MDRLEAKKQVKLLGRAGTVSGYFPLRGLEGKEQPIFFEEEWIYPNSLVQHLVMLSQLEARMQFETY